MKLAPVLTAAAVWISLPCSQAQTNVSPSDFSLPAMKLRAELKLDSPAPPKPSPFPVHALDTNSPPRDVSASTGDMPAALESYNVHSDQFYLVPTVQPAPDDPVDRAFNWVGEPEIVKVGNKSVACSAVTAVKRKNPRCLLNATFLKMTW